ncbi:MAG TPA: winged helix-turn-helix transcriptional regulator [Candidatus Bathyarchaeia archaeon]|nr:winged helix-turn-helix transcriptional regulator [Candidatus Bathyarchaeia archaeon]
MDIFGNLTNHYIEDSANGNKSNLKLDRSHQIVKIIEKNPGIKFREIMREIGMKNGVLGYYANKLEKEGVVKVERRPGQTRFFPPSVSDSDILIIKNLRQETPRQILTSLLRNEMLSFSELVKNVKKSPATVSLYLTQLKNDGMVESSLINLKRYHKIKNIEKLQMMINKYHPTLIERSADRLADTFSSL